MITADIWKKKKISVKDAMLVGWYQVESIYLFGDGVAVAAIIL